MSAIAWMDHTESDERRILAVIEIELALDDGQCDCPECNAPAA